MHVWATAIRPVTNQSMIHGPWSMVLIIAIIVFASSARAVTSLKFEFTEDEGFLMLEGQLGFVASQELAAEAGRPNEMHIPGAIVNNYDLGVDGKPGVIELLAIDESTGPRQDLDAPLTGDATFSVWFNKNGNIPDDPASGPDDFARQGNSGLVILLGEPITFGANYVDVFAVRIDTRNTVQGLFLKYQKRPGGSFSDFGFFPKPPLPQPLREFPPAEGWWGVRADLHWNPNKGENGRYTSWDLYYRELGDPDWTLIEADLQFRVQDDEGYNHEIRAIHLWSRPCGGCGDPGYGPRRILMDDVFLSPMGGPAVFESAFSPDEGLLMLEGQNGWVNPGSTETGLVNTHEFGRRGFVELIGDENSFPSRPFEARTSDTTFIGWFNRVGVVPAVYGPDDENFDPDRPGHSGLQVALGSDSYDLDDAAVLITTRDTNHALQYQKGPGDLGVGPTPPNSGWFGLRADVHWDAAADGGRFTAWDFYYTLEGDEDWTLVEGGLGFASQDGLGYDHDLNALMTWNRPCVECGDSDGFGQNRILMDSMFVGDCDACLDVPIPGDIDGDSDIDFTDFSILAGNFTGTLGPGEGDKTRDNGDFDGDGDVDFGDFSVLAGNFTGTITAPVSDLPNEGEVHLGINVDTGTMTLEASNASLAGYSVRSSDSKIVPDADGAASPFLFYLLNAPQEVTAGTVGAATMLTADVSLDITFGGSVEEAQNVVFEYTRFGEVTPVAGIAHVVPEPATMILLVAGGLLLVPRRWPA